jgi:hypothetical protein
MHLKGKSFKLISISLMLIVIAIGTSVGFLQMRPPSPPSESDTDYPAYGRMLANVKAISVAPHPSGSEELEAVRSYLLAQIRDMGLEATVESEKYVEDHNADVIRPKGSKNAELHPQIQTTPSSNENEEVILKNIVVKLDAPGTERGVLMLAHYDSEDNTPGAADDTIAVSALLDAMREQASNASLQNDLYFLFTDGEEFSGDGAKAFVESHPDLQNSIDLVINMDARGNRGGLFMFETSANNDKLVRSFGSASSRPIAFSFLTEIYHRMPNGTDLTRFLDAGYSGLNFAVAEGVENYHEPSDTFENLDRGTAYHFLQNALEMAAYGAEGKFQDNHAKQDSVFFPLLPGHLIIMNNITEYFLSGIVVLSALLWLGIQIQLGRIRFRQIIVGTGWLLGTMIVMILLCWGLVSLATQTMQLNESTNNNPVFWCISLVLSVGALAIFIFRMRKQSLTEALAGLLPLQLLLMIGTTVFFHAISYLFTLPSLAVLIVAILERNRMGRLIASTVFGLGILLLYVPVCWLIYVLLMLPVTPVAIALSVIPISMITAFFATEYMLPKDKQCPNHK